MVKQDLQPRITMQEEVTKSTWVGREGGKGLGKRLLKKMLSICNKNVNLLSLFRSHTAPRLKSLILKSLFIMILQGDNVFILIMYS